MQWNLDKDRAICPQICEQLCMQIALGRFKPNERLLSVRETAVSAGVNPNTVQRSFEILEQNGILYSVRGSGWYVSENISAAAEALQKAYREKTAAYFNQMRLLGMEPAEIKNYVKEWEI